ncbi:MAG: nucleotidyltransferase domain-containing protein [Bacteroidales bacterium]
MGQSEVIKELSLYKSLVSRYFDLEKMILFGSYARGTQREHSDIDVAVIVRKIDGDFFATTPILWKLRRDIDTRIEPILFEKDNDPSGFLDEIIRTGIEIP